MKRKIPLGPFWLIALALVGLGDALYLSYYQYLNLVPGCAILNGCEQVLSHPLSKFFNVPLGYLGVVYYGYLLGLAFLLAFEPRSAALQWGMLAYAAIGLLCSIAFEFIQVSIIGAVCMYCAISAVITLFVFIAAISHVRVMSRL